MMRFCTNCDNMLYVRLDDHKVLTQYCKNCGHEEQSSPDAVGAGGPSASPAAAAAGALPRASDIVHDPTLPRVNHIRCINADCASTKPGAPLPPEVIYMKTDPVNLKYLYFCTTCETFWNNA
jgi:hypothetical protein